MTIIFGFYLTVYVIGKRNENLNLNVPIDSRSNEQPTTSDSASIVRNEVIDNELRNS